VHFFLKFNLISSCVQIVTAGATGNQARPRGLTAKAKGGKKGGEAAKKGDAPKKGDTLKKAAAPKK